MALQKSPRPPAMHDDEQHHLVVAIACLSTYGDEPRTTTATRSAGQKERGEEALVRPYKDAPTRRFTIRIPPPHPCSTYEDPYAAMRAQPRPTFDDASVTAPPCPLDDMRAASYPSVLLIIACSK